MKRNLLCISLIILSLFSSCSPRETASKMESNSPETVDITERDVDEEIKTVPVEIVYLEGFASLIHEGESIEAEIGLMLETGDSLKVDPDSYCEIQVGQISLVSLEAETFITLDRNLYAGNSTQARLNLEEGSLLCKVQKLTGEDRFQVRTESTTCGVRGTEFIVTADKEKGETHLAVVEGTVALTPSDVDWDQIKDNALLDDENLQASLEEVELSFPVVQAGEEIRIDKEQMNPLSEEIRITEELIQTDPEERVEKIQEQAASMKQQYVPLPVKPMAEESLQKVRTLRPREDDSASLVVPAMEEEIILGTEEQVPGDSDSSTENRQNVSITIPGLKKINHDDPNLLYMGRIYDSLEGPKYSYPGVTMRMKFRGSRRLAMSIRNYNPNPDGIYKTFYFVSIDGGEAERIALDPKEEIYVLSTRLDEGEHLVEVVRNQYSSTDVFLGFLLEQDAEVLPLDRPDITIEFIGDSFTSGYGNELEVGVAEQLKNPDPYHYSTANSNVYRSWGLIAARELGAAYRMVARHGSGMTRNYDNTAMTIPNIYDRILIEDAQTNIEHPENDPADLIVICVGKDDFGEGLDVDNGEYRDMRREYVNVYSDFLAKLRGYYPDAPFVLTLGPQISDSWPEGYNARSSVMQDLQSIKALRRKMDDNNVYILVLDERTDPLGADFHPAIHDHEKAAENLLTFIKKNQLLR